MACIFTVAAISSWMNGNKENALGSLALTLIAIGGVIYSVYYARALDRVAEKAVIE